MAILTVQQVSKAGVVSVSAALASAGAAGDSVPSASGLLIVLENTDSGPHTLTIAAPAATAACGDLGDLAVGDVTLTVANGATGFLAVPSGYSDSNNHFAWTYDDETGLAVGVFSNAP